MSDTIRVRSIVGRFLEHSRIFHFANGGEDEIYLGSADWMPRNLFERCEVVFPVRDKAAKARIHEEILPAYLADMAKARLMGEDGMYVRAYENRGTRSAKAAGDDYGPKGFSSQQFLMNLAEGKADLRGIPQAGVEAAVVGENGKAPRKRTPAKAAAKSDGETAAPAKKTAVRKRAAVTAK